ncbi:MAG: SpoIIE family protein phosphatase [Thermoanaerobaculia bacterium]|nr:SpoIIE family protein phosphatase [Thermoanaerobaculia bacterium]
MPALHVRPDALFGSGYTVPFDQERLLVGRSRTCDVMLADPYLSRRHLVLFRDGERVFAQDISTNGTELNGARLHAIRELHPGDVLRLSGHEISLLTDEDVTSTQVFWAEISDLDSDSWRELLAEPSTAGDGDRRLFRAVHEALNAPHESEAHLLRLIVDIACDGFQAQYAAIFLRREDGLFDRAESRAPADGKPIPYSHHLLDTVCRGRAARLPDIVGRSGNREAEAMASSGVRSLLAVPLPGDDLGLGALVLGSTTANRFTADDLSTLANVGSIAGLRVTNTRLIEEAARRKAELVGARVVQESLLPKQLREIPGYEVFADNLPSRGVSGDYYNVFPCHTAARWALVVVDVSGKGMPAALLTASLDSMLDAQLELEAEPEVVCRRVSKRLLERTRPERYATAFVGVLDPETGALDYCNAAHVTGVLVRSNGTVEELPQTGPPLGLLEGLSFDRGETRMEAGDLLVVVSDGLTEAESVEEEEFGLARLVEILVELRSRPLEELSESVHLAIADFTGGAPAHDDRTILATRCL